MCDVCLELRRGVQCVSRVQLDVVTLLNSMYTVFDRITELHPGVYKVCEHVGSRRGRAAAGGDGGVSRCLAHRWRPSRTSTCWCRARRARAASTRTTSQRWRSPSARPPTPSPTPRTRAIRSNCSSVRLRPREHSVPQYLYSLSAPARRSLGARRRAHRSDRRWRSGAQDAALLPLRRYAHSTSISGSWLLTTCCNLRNIVLLRA